MFIQALTYLLLVLHAAPRVASSMSSTPLVKDHPTFHFGIVTLPISHHFEPLLALASSLIKKGHRVTMAVPSSHVAWAKSYQIPTGVELIVTRSTADTMSTAGTGDAGDAAKLLLENAIVSHEDRSYQRNDHVQSWYAQLVMFEFSKLSDALSRKGLYDTVGSLMSYYNTFHAPMLGSLLEQYTNDPPDLFVVDRYTFAGISVANSLNVPYVINSPGPLSDIDNPSNHVPAPLSGNSIHRQSILGRCLNLVYRIRYRLIAADTYEEINTIRQNFSIVPITTREEMYGTTAVLANTVFGIDDARPMSPLILIVGALDFWTARDFVGGSKTAAATCLQEKKKSKQKKKMGRKRRPSIVVQLSARVPIPKAVLSTIFRALLSLKDHPQGIDVICIAPREGDALYDYDDTDYMENKNKNRNRNKNKNKVDAAVQRHCTKILPPFSPENVPALVAAADAMILSGDSAQAYRAVTRGQPMIVLPFFADQLDMAVRLERVGCGIMINPMSPSNVLKNDITRAIMSVVVDGSVRNQMLQSMKWMRGVLLSTGGTPAATNYVETVAMYGTSSITPHRDGLVWYSKYALDVYAVYIVVLVVMWLTTKTCSSAMSILWNSMNQAELSNLN
jgi:hypothetical protein